MKYKYMDVMWHSSHDSKTNIGLFFIYLFFFLFEIFPNVLTILENISILKYV